MSNECGFTCLGCGQFRPGPEGAHSEAACLRVQLAAANERAGRLEKALEFYANAENNREIETGIGMMPSRVNLDGGERAREALEAPDA
jgi:hypothetical protein